eukprot:357723-Chlamydomonas_euryale.AAC.8
MTRCLTIARWHACPTHPAAAWLQQRSHPAACWCREGSHCQGQQTPVEPAVSAERGVVSGVSRARCCEWCQQSEVL